MNTITDCKECDGIGHIKGGSHAICCPNCKGYGKLFEAPFISPSMGVNTKPAHKMVWNGYWIDMDPKMPEHVFQHLRKLIKGE